MPDVFYSISPFGTGDIQTGSGNISISSGVATIPAQTGNIGIGCAIEFLSTVVYISAVNSPTSYDVITATGGTPGDQGSTSLTSIHHVWASLSAAEAAYTGGSFINTTNLVTGTFNVFLCCYVDHDDQTEDTTVVDFNGATVNTTYFTKVLTPQGGTESINDQRGDFTSWDSTKYIINESSGSETSGVIKSSYAYLEIEGLQMRSESTGGVNARVIFSDTDNASLKVHKSFLRGADVGGGITINIESYGLLEVQSCILLGTGTPSFNRGIHFNVATSGTIDAEYLTMENWGRALEDDGSGTFNTKDCAIFNNGDDFNGTFDSVTYTATDDNDEAGTGNFAIHGTYNSLFTNRPGLDYSLADYTSTGALIDAGNPVSGITDDIRDNTRDVSTPAVGAFANVAGGGTIFDYTNTESALASDSNINQLIMSESLTEVSESSDTNIDQTIFTESLSETVNSGDENSENLIFNESISETAKSGATIQEILIKIESITESIIAGDTINEVSLLVESITEGSVAADFESYQVVFDEILTEGILASDLIQSLSIFGEVTTETALAGVSDGETPTGLIEGPIKITVSVKQPGFTIETKQATILLTIKQPTIKTEIG